MSKRIFSNTHHDVMICAYTIVRRKFQYRSREHSIEFSPDNPSHAKEHSTIPAKLCAFRIIVGSASFAQNGVGSHTWANGVLGRIQHRDSLWHQRCRIGSVKANIFKSRLNTGMELSIPQLRGQPLAKAEQQQSLRKPARVVTEAQSLLIELKWQPPFPSKTG